MKKRSKVGINDLSQRSLRNFSSDRIVVPSFLCLIKLAGAVHPQIKYPVLPDTDPETFPPFDKIISSISFLEHFIKRSSKNK